MQADRQFQMRFRVSELSPETGIADREMSLLDLHRIVAVGSHAHQLRRHVEREFVAGSGTGAGPQAPDGSKHIRLPAWRSPSASALASMRQLPRPRHIPRQRFAARLRPLSRSNSSCSLSGESAMRSTAASPALKWRIRFALLAALAGLVGRAQPEECSLLNSSPAREMLCDQPG